MSSALPRLFLARHGDTAWTDSHRHTGRTDLPLNGRGMENARGLGERLRPFSFARVFTSPLQRASKTCELAGFGAVAEVDRDLLEWDYGRFDGMTTSEILEEAPDWELFRDGCPNGESPEKSRSRRPLSRAGAGLCRRCAGVFQRPHYPNDRGALAWAAARGWAVVLLRSRERRYPRLRTRPPRTADYSPVEPRGSIA